MKSIELLAPAKNLACGIAAINHGADAVYIGAKRFGARAAAGNSVEDIAELCRYAHLFGAKVYVTINTIIYDGELTETRQLMKELNAVGVDAFLIQDMGLIEREERREGRGERILSVLHASTQTDNRTVEKVKWLRSLGFKRVVLARELSLDEISEIHAAVPDVELEVFIHGALCVSYSGVCYASFYCFHRSANRGECAQFCRLKFDLKDSDGNTIGQQRHFLSLRDMCRIDYLEELMEAGAVSFKIEGRLKDVTYVKNVVTAYSQRLNAIIAKYPNRYRRASLGRCTYSFEPRIDKTFNRGFTTYFLHGRKNDIASPDTPKAMGEYVGKVKEIRGNSFNVAGTAAFANGDGLCFINDNHELEGFRVNRVEGNRLFPLKMPAHLRPGMVLYRNQDVAFEKILSCKTVERKIPVMMSYETIDNGFRLTTKINGSNVKGESTVEFDHQLAARPQESNIRQQLGKLGDTPYVLDDLEIVGDAASLFIPNSLLTKLRREGIAVMSAKMVREISDTSSIPSIPDIPSIPNTPNTPNTPLEHPYLLNIANDKARAFYEGQGVSNIQPAFELGKEQYHNPLLMQCRHCLRYSLGYCQKHGGKKPIWREPLYLELPDKRRFRLEFKCDKCQMNVYGE